MKLYTKTKNNITLLKEIPFKLEKDIQKLFESQLSELVGLQLVKSEFTIKNKRIDMLAFDPQNKAFIIIEYKRSKSNSVVDQGFATCLPRFPSDQRAQGKRFIFILS